MTIPVDTDAAGLARTEGVAPGMQPTPEDDDEDDDDGSDVPSVWQPPSDVAAGCEALPELRPLPTSESVRARLVAEWCPKSAEETELVDRLGALVWRREALCRALTLGLSTAPFVARLRSPPPAPATMPPLYVPGVEAVAVTPALDSWDPVEIRRATVGLGELTLAVFARRAFTYDEAHQWLEPAIGAARLAGFHGDHWFGLWHLITQCRWAVQRSVGPESPEERVARWQAYKALLALEDALSAREEMVLDARVSLREATREWPALRYAEVHERHRKMERELGTEIDEVTARLHDARGRRRLAELGRAWLAR